MSKGEAKARAAAAEAYAESQMSWPARHKLLTGLVVLLLAMVGAFIATRGGSETPARTTGGGGDSGQVAKMAGLNTPVVDGNFQFTVRSVSCGATSVGPEALAEKAQGQFCLVKMEVRNIGNEAQMLDGTSQYAFDAQGKRYSVNTAAEILVADPTFLKEINPGNTVFGTVIFDVPKTTKIDHLKLHDAPFSSGVSVKVD